LTERLREEIRANREKVDADFKRELMLEKRRILSQAVSYALCYKFRMMRKRRSDKRTSNLTQRSKGLRSFSDMEASLAS
jgi:hypothetical protein